MTQMIFGCIAACILAIFFAITDAERTNPCSGTQYWVENSDGSTLCEDCPSCLPGQGLSEECGQPINSSAFVTCEPCQPKFSFSSKHDTSMCAFCSSCAEDQVVLRNCTPEWDIKCAKRCTSVDRYYNHAMGECLPCSKCCGDNQDLVEVECQEKRGPGSNMICSFDTSVNRCGEVTNLRTLHKLTAVAKELTASPDNYTSSSQGPKSDQTEPPTKSNNLSQRKEQDFWTAAIIPVVILALMAICGCAYIYKTGRANGCVWSHSDAERGSAGALDADGAKETQLSKIKILPTSLEPLLKEDGSEILICSCQMDTKKDSKPLSSLLEKESDLQKICECLDTPMPGAFNYRVVALNYGSNHYQITSVFEKHLGGPSRALIEFLNANKPDLTVAEFASAVRTKAKRNDVVKLLEKYDLE